MLRDVQTNIWEVEFSRFKALGAREGLRREYDAARDQQAHITAAYKADMKNENLKLQAEAVDKQVKLKKDQMDDMDIRINGREPQEPSEEFPHGIEGEVGITQKLEGLIELREYIKQFVKHNV